MESRLEKIGAIIAVAAGKGGVGKSTITINLALAFQSMGKRVGILDADLYGPSLQHLLPEEMGMVPSPRGEEAMIPALFSGIEMVSMAYFRKKGEESAFRAPIANGVIDQFLDKVEWSELDYLLIDFPPGTGDIQLTLAQKGYLTGVLGVTTPSEVATLDVGKAMRMFERMQVPLLGIVENMSFLELNGERHFVFGKGGGSSLAAEFGMPLLAQVPLDPLLSDALESGKSIFHHKKYVSVRGQFAELAKKVIECIASQEKDWMVMEDLEVIENQLKIVWADGFSAKISLSEIQARCPCIRCRDDLNEKCIVEDEPLLASGVKKVGRYGVKISFKRGCSKGIFSTALLRKLAILQMETCLEPFFPAQF